LKNILILRFEGKLDFSCSFLGRNFTNIRHRTKINKTTTTNKQHNTENKKDEQHRPHHKKPEDEPKCS
jgi:hypothetical protein